MTPHRLSRTAATLLTIGATLIAPAAASAGSLLSGYGGPGQGNQEILGGGVVGGPSGGGGSGSGGQAGAPAAATAASLALPASAAAATQTHAGTEPGSAAHSGSGATGARTRRSRPTAAGAQGVAHARALNLAPARAASDGSPTAGLSGGDVVYIVLALAVLALTAALTWSLTRRQGYPGG
jgi:hypothetical protein